MPDAPCARSLVCELERAHKRSHHGHTGNARHSPRDGFTGSFVLFPGTGLSCPRHRRGVSGPLGPTSPSRRLDTSVGASEPHDFSVRGQCIRLVHCRVHRIPHPTFVTTAKRPS